MMILHVDRLCPQCGGTGIYDRVGEIIDPCPCCQGEKVVADYLLDITDLYDRQNDILEKCNDILEKCNDILEKFE